MVYVYCVWRGAALVRRHFRSEHTTCDEFNKYCMEWVAYGVDQIEKEAKKKHAALNSTYIKSINKICTPRQEDGQWFKYLLSLSTKKKMKTDGNREDALLEIYKLKVWVVTKTQQRGSDFSRYIFMICDIRAVCVYNRRGWGTLFMWFEFSMNIFFFFLSICVRERRKTPGICIYTDVASSIKFNYTKLIYTNGLYQSKLLFFV